VRENWFCPLDKCQWYGDSSKYGRKCYFEPNCWRGYLDLIIMLFVFWFRKKRGGGEKLR